MGGRLAKNGAVQLQVDVNIENAVSAARDHLARGERLKQCEECSVATPEAHQEAITDVRQCILCQEAAHFTGYILRGSRDSQLY